jgi:hypothetical protein
LKTSIEKKSADVSAISTHWATAKKSGGASIKHHQTMSQHLQTLNYNFTGPAKDHSKIIHHYFSSGDKSKCNLDSLARNVAVMDPST